MMDGYAVRLSDAGRAVPVIGEAAAGSAYEGGIVDGQALSIMTGAPCPEGAEAVVPVEEAVEADGRLPVPAELSRGKHIAPRGSECAAGMVVAEIGDPVTPLTIGNLAAFGQETVSVIRRPRVQCITTGSEVVDGEAPPKAGQIRNANGPMLEALLQDMAVHNVTLHHAQDTRDALSKQLKKTSQADMVILCGGVSAGKYDLVPAALEAHGVTLLFHKVAQKPGKPLLFGVKGETLFFGLPGNPLACLHCFHHYVAPALRKRMGHTSLLAPCQGILEEALSAKGSRVVFQLCHARFERDAWRILPLRGKGSADLFNVCRANAFLRLEVGASFDAGTKVSVLPMGSME
jgi:molybdopterin molybdotransferase